MPNFTRVAVATVLSLLCAPGAFAAGPFPDRPVRMIVPLPPGTASDFLARTLGQTLSDQYKQQVVIDNRPGAGGLIGSGIVAKSTPDGYTLAMIAPPHLVSPLLQATAPYRAIEDFAPVIKVASVPNVIVVAPNIAARTVPELVALLKSRPADFNYGSSGIGTASHIAPELFNRAAGVKIQHVPFKVLPDVMTEMSAGRVHYVLFTTPAALTILRGDSKLRAIAVTSAKRSAAFSDLPTVAEAGLPEAQSEVWLGIVAPAGTPRGVIAKINADVAALLQRPETKEKFARQGAEVADDLSSAGFDKLLRAEYQRYRKLVQESGMKSQ